MPDSPFDWPVTVNGRDGRLTTSGNPVSPRIILSTFGYNSRRYALFPAEDAPDTADAVSDTANAPNQIDLEEHNEFVALPIER
jgi:hypothetical protein